MQIQIDLEGVDLRKKADQVLKEPSEGSSRGDPILAVPNFVLIGFEVSSVPQLHSDGARRIFTSLMGSGLPEVTTAPPAPRGLGPSCFPQALMLKGAGPACSAFAAGWAWFPTNLIKRDRLHGRTG